MNKFVVDPRRAPGCRAYTAGPPTVKTQGVWNMRVCVDLWPLPVADGDPWCVVEQQGWSCSFIVITEADDSREIGDVDVHDDPTALKTHTHVKSPEMY